MSIYKNSSFAFSTRWVSQSCCFLIPSAAEAETRGRPRWQPGGDPLVTLAELSIPAFLGEFSTLIPRRIERRENFPVFPCLCLGFQNSFLVNVGLGLAWGWKELQDDSVDPTLDPSDIPAGQEIHSPGGGEGGEKEGSEEQRVGDG